MQLGGFDHLEGIHAMMSWRDWPSYETLHRPWVVWIAHRLGNRARSQGSPRNAVHHRPCRHPGPVSY